MALLLPPEDAVFVLCVSSWLTAPERLRSDLERCVRARAAAARVLSGGGGAADAELTDLNARAALTALMDKMAEDLPQAAALRATFRGEDWSPPAEWRTGCARLLTSLLCNESTASADGRALATESSLMAVRSIDGLGAHRRCIVALGVMVLCELRKRLGADGVLGVRNAHTMHTAVRLMFGEPDVGRTAAVVWFSATAGGEFGDRWNAILGALHSVGAIKAGACDIGAEAAACAIEGGRAL